MKIQNIFNVFILTIAFMQDFAWCDIPNNDTVPCSTFSTSCTQCLQSSLQKCSFIRHLEANETECNNANSTLSTIISKAIVYVVYDDCEDANKTSNNLLSTTKSSSISPIETISTALAIQTSETTTISTTTSVTTTTTSTTTTTTTSVTTNTEIGSTPSSNKKSGGFNGMSFFGGILLVLSVCLAAFCGYKRYRSSRIGTPFSYRCFGSTTPLASRPVSDELGLPF